MKKDGPFPLEPANRKMTYDSKNGDSQQRNVTKYGKTNLWIDICVDNIWAKLVISARSTFQGDTYKYGSDKTDN